MLLSIFLDCIKLLCLQTNSQLLLLPMCISLKLQWGKSPPQSHIRVCAAADKSSATWPTLFHFLVFTDIHFPLEITIRLPLLCCHIKPRQNEVMSLPPLATVITNKHNTANKINEEIQNEHISALFISCHSNALQAQFMIHHVQTTKNKKPDRA